jgi:hypothetical protein
MFTRHQQDVAKALRPQRARLAPDLLLVQRHPQDRVVPGEPAILAVVDALVGQIQRGKHPDHLAESLLPGQRLRTQSAHLLQQPVGGRRDQMRKVRQRDRLPSQTLAGRGERSVHRPLEQGRSWKPIKIGGKTHAPKLTEPLPLSSSRLESSPVMPWVGKTRERCSDLTDIPPWRWNCSEAHQ